MKLIESKTLGTAQAAIEFTSIPGTFTDLVLLCSARTTEAVLVSSLFLTLNDNTSITTRTLLGSGSGVASQTPGNVAGYASGASSTSNTFGNNTMYFPNYSITATKSYSVDSVTENNGVDGYQFIVAGVWNGSTSPITKISIAPSGANLAAGTIFSLYGVLKGSDGIVTTSP